MNPRVLAIALTSFREAIRDRVLFAMLGLGAASVFFGMTFGSIAYAESVRILVDWGLFTISLLSNLIAIFLGANFLYKELELRTLYVLLAKPVARYEVILGKYAGILVTVAVFVCVTATLLLGLVTVTSAEESITSAQRLELFAAPVAHLLRSRALRLGLLAGVTVLAAVVLLLPKVRRRLTLAAVLPVVGAFFAVFAAVAWVVAPSESQLILGGCALVMMEVAIIGAFAMLYSSFSTPFVTGLFSVGTFIIARSTWLMQHLPRGGIPAGVRALLTSTAKVVPNLHLLVPSRAALLSDNGSGPVLMYLGGCLAYSAFFATVLLVASSLLFRRRDLL